MLFKSSLKVSLTGIAKIVAYFRQAFFSIGQKTFCFFQFSGQASYVTPTHINYYVERVKGGSALNIVEVCSVHTPSAPRGFLSISEDEYIPGLKELTDAIHAEGGKAGLQLWQGSLAVGSDQTAQILMACDTPFSEEITLPGATIEEIKEVVTCFGKAAARAVEA